MKAGTVRRRFFPGGVVLHLQEPRLLPPHLRLVLAILANCGAVRRVVVVQPDVKSLVHSDVALTLELVEARHYKYAFGRVCRCISVVDLPACR